MPFLLTPLREGRHGAAPVDARAGFISTHAPAGGATGSARLPASVQGSFLLTPLREGRHADGDDCTQTPLISTHAPAGGATAADGPVGIRGLDFYSRPCGRGDTVPLRWGAWCWPRFLLTPLREGRQELGLLVANIMSISTHAPAGGATRHRGSSNSNETISTHAPAGGATEGAVCFARLGNFYSRPCGRGDLIVFRDRADGHTDFYSRPCGRGDV